MPPEVVEKAFQETHGILLKMSNRLENRAAAR
jgi:hypothetical protein